MGRGKIEPPTKKEVPKILKLLDLGVPPLRIAKKFNHTCDDINAIKICRKLPTVAATELVVHRSSHGPGKTCESITERFLNQMEYMDGNDLTVSQL